MQPENASLQWIVELKYWMLGEWIKRERGFAPHYDLLFSFLVGLDAKSVLEFGTGGTTHVILYTLRSLTNGRLYSISTESKEAVERGSLVLFPGWEHWTGNSELCRTQAIEAGAPFDLVVHDGSHTCEVASLDLTAALRATWQYGLVLVHDTEHSQHGFAMRAAIEIAIGTAKQDGVRVSKVTLPWGFGLTILRIENTPFYQRPKEFARSNEKRTSVHKTIPRPQLG